MSYIGSFTCVYICICINIILYLKIEKIEKMNFVVCDTYTYTYTHAHTHIHKDILLIMKYTVY